MSVIATYRCTICSKLKNDADKDWLVGMPVKVPMFRIAPVMYSVIRWEPEVAVRPQADHLCSDGCAVKALSAWLRELRESDTEEPDDLPSVTKKLEPLLN